MDTITLDTAEEKIIQQRVISDMEKTKIADSRRRTTGRGHSDI